jgi:hypothetical protein
MEQSPAWQIFTKYALAMPCAHSKSTSSRRSALPNASHVQGQEVGNASRTVDCACWFPQLLQPDVVTKVIRASKKLSQRVGVFGGECSATFLLKDAGLAPLICSSGAACSRYAGLLTHWYCATQLLC